MGTSVNVTEQQSKWLNSPFQNSISNSCSFFAKSNDI